MDDIRVAWVNEGSASDDPWTLAQFHARDLVERTFAGRVTTTFVERVELGAHAVETFEQLVESGHELVVATSAALAPDLLSVAARRPATAFEQARGRVVTSNVSTFTGTHEQSAYLTGLAAGALSTSGVVAYVAPVFEVETLRILNGFATGVETARPGSVVITGWTDAWWDPAAERRAAELLATAGADVLATGCTGTATGELALELGLPWCGQDADRTGEFGAVWVTAPRVLPGPHYCRRVSDLLGGRWRSQAYVGGLADGFTDVAPLGPVVPSAVRRTVMEARSRMLDGSERPDLGFPTVPDPPRPVDGTPVDEWAASTHVGNVRVVLPPAPDPRPAPAVGSPDVGR